LQGKSHAQSYQRSTKKTQFNSDLICESPQRQRITNAYLTIANDSLQ